jgi:aminoglycoside phosphotransferase (APT) family kinase protein
VTMHDGELPIDVALVARLLAAQVPALAGRPLRTWPSTGTVNATFRLGDDLAVRLPRLPDWAAALERESTWLPWLAPRVSLRVPERVAVGRPTADYPCTWAVDRWLAGEPFGDGVADEPAAAAALGGFVRELRALDPAGGPPAGRAPLRDLDAETRAAIGAGGDAMAAAGVAFDADAALAAWTGALEAPAWDGVPTWIHGDLMRPNLLVVDGLLDAVLDFGGVGVGDPAMDLVAAWSVFGRSGRASFRAASREDARLDAGAWARARGYALHQAALIVPYYAASNPAFAAEGARIVGEVVGDVG